MAQTGYTPILIYSSSTASQAPAVGNLTNSTLGSELAINITDGKLFYKDNANAVQVIAWKVTPTTAGGTGLTSYTAGDLLYYASGTTLTKLAIGASGRWLGSSGSAPQWNAPGALTETDDTNVTLTLGGSPSTALLSAVSMTLGWTGQLAVTRGGTGLATVAQGDILYGSASNTLAALAKNTTATRYLSNTGTNNNPAWAQIDLTNGVTGTLPTGNGGTGLSSFTANRVLYTSSASAIGQSANLTFDGTTLTAANNASIAGLMVGKGANSLSANTAFGVSALAGITTSNGSTAIGYQAATALTTASGSVVTAIGYRAAYTMTTGGVQSTFVGTQSGLNLTASYNTAVGELSLQGTSGSATGQFNTAVGIATGQVLQSGSNNALFGIYVGAALTTGSANAAFGGNASANSAGSALTTGSSNSLFGNTAGGTISTGSKNSVFGNYTGNQGGLDIRTKSNYIVLSDGDGNPQQVISPQGTLEFPQANGKFIKFEGFFGWQNVTSVTQDLATLFPDVVFTNGAISLTLQILSGSNTTNSGSTIFNVVRQTNGTWSSASVSSVTGGITVSSVTGSSTSITITFSAANQYGYCNVIGLVNV